MVLAVNGRPVEYGDGNIELPLAAGANLLEARTIAPNGDSQTYRWTVVSLQARRRRHHAPAARTRARRRGDGGDAVHRRQGRADGAGHEREAVPVALAFDSAVRHEVVRGGRPRQERRPHRSRPAQASIPAGAVDVTAQATIDGQPVTATVAAEYAGEQLRLAVRAGSSRLARRVRVN